MYDYKDLLSKYRNGDQHISHSQIAKYANCPKSWWYYMVAKLQLNRIDTMVGKRTLGKLIHMGLDQAIRRRLPSSNVPDSFTLSDMYNVWFQEEVTQYDGVLEEELFMLKDLIFQAEAIVPKVIRELDLDKNNWETLHDKDGVPIIEYELTSILPNGVKMLSYVDWAVRDKDTGQLFVIDFKTTGRKKISYDLDVQVSGIYNVAMQQVGIIDDHAEAVIIEIDSKELKRPALNKDGTMSKAMIHSTWNIYKSELEYNDLDPNDYLDMRRKLMGIKFVKEHRILRTKAESYNIWNNRSSIVDQIMESLAKDKDEAFPANLNNTMCYSCEYLEACKEDVAGFGFKDLVDAGIYTIRNTGGNHGR